MQENVTMRSWLVPTACDRRKMCVVSTLYGVRWYLALSAFAAVVHSASQAGQGETSDHDDLAVVTSGGLGTSRGTGQMYVPVFSAVDLDVSQCGPDSPIEITGTEGLITGLSANSSFNATHVVCVIRLTVSAGNIIQFRAGYARESCYDDITIETEKAPPCSDFTSLLCMAGGLRYARTMLSKTSQTTITVSDPSVSTEHLPRFFVRFLAVPESARWTLRHEAVSRVSGYVTPYCPDGGLEIPVGTDATYMLTVPAGHVVLISFPVLWRSLGSDNPDCPTQVTISPVTGNRSVFSAVRIKPAFSARIYQDSVTVRVISKYFRPAEFKMFYTLYDIAKAPRQMNNGKFDCSGPDYASFKQHVHCNLKPECQGGEDEGGHCPFSSPACKGLVATTGKCYRLINLEKTIVWDEAQRECQRLGGNLATIKTNQQWQDFETLLEYSREIAFSPYIGLQRSPSSLPIMYRNVLTWVDGSVVYNVNTLDFWAEISFDTRLCSVYDSNYFPTIRLVPCNMNGGGFQSFVCEFPINSSSDTSVEFPDLRLSVTSLTNRCTTGKGREPLSGLSCSHTNLTLVPCPQGHLTQAFLSCDLQSFCGADKSLAQCTTVKDGNAAGHVTTAMFACDDGIATVPYTLLCDFRPDCADRSDENFCLRPDQPCTGFWCANGKCVTSAWECDKEMNCWDEHCSMFLKYNMDSTYRMEPPAVVHFDSTGNFTQELWTWNRLCPVTHFRCPQSYCLPVYLRCNGVLDCPGREDEDQCQSFTCSGFYRCRASSVCVHVQHLCDGWPQCPQHDDELLCQVTCPEDCSCQGLSFVCARPFPAHSFPDLRYLDAAGSGMTPEELSQNVYLVWLSLSSCRLHHFPGMDCPNLRYFDLSENDIASVHVASVLSLQNLKVLVLAGNPLASIISTNDHKTHATLMSLDLSHTHLSDFSSIPLSVVPEITTLNLSFCGIDVIPEEGFQHPTQLEQLDLRGNSLTEFPTTLLKGLVKLRLVVADNYKLCCRDTLPDSFSDNRCFAPQDEISSCQDLLRSGVYRVFLWAFSVLSALGNSGCILFRLAAHRRIPLSGFSVFVTSLSLADLLMGVYLALVGVADTVYRGQYLWFDNAWKSSVSCQIAGFLSLLSSEVSALMICLITFDRFLIFRFPFSRLHFRRHSAMVACGIVWTIGFVIAALPLLPVTSHWHFYRQSGICIPLPITRKDFGGQRYAFGVIIVLNLVLFLLIAAGQSVIFWTIRLNSLSRESGWNSREMVVARRLTSIVLSDFLCWFPIGVLGLLASTGTPIPSEVNVGMAIFVLPLNSALNPFLYTFNSVIDRRRRANKERKQKQLQEPVFTDRSHDQVSVPSGFT